MIFEHEGFRLISRSISGDGKILVYSQPGKVRLGVWIKNMDDTNDQGKPLLDTQFGKRGPVISPDGRSVAYGTNQGRGNEIYLRRIHRAGIGIPVSSDGGSQPRWSADGDKLFYGNNRSIWSVNITVKEGGYEPATPKEWQF